MISTQRPELRNLLIVDDDSSIHISVKSQLKGLYSCFSAYSLDEALTILKSSLVDVILLDMSLEKTADALEYIETFLEASPDLDIVIFSSNQDHHLAGQALARGAAGYLLKDCPAEQLRITLDSTVLKRQLLLEKEHFSKDRGRQLQRNPLIGRSEAMGVLLKKIEKIRLSKANVLITGQTGTGKELVARHIGAVDHRPFVAVDSATILGSMAESILFGHEKGAFTGAASMSRGLFEEANGGTLFFDEIGNMTLDIQQKLLRVLQEKEISRLGSRKMIPLEFRLICATNLDLQMMCEQGQFKRDLLERINVIPIQTPALSERLDDLPDLVDHFFKVHRHSRSPHSLSSSAMEALCNYDWPGNIRELSNTVAFVCTMAVDQTCAEIEDLPDRIRQHYAKSKRSNTGASAPLASAALSSKNFADGIIKQIDDGNAVDFYQLVTDFEGELLKELFLRYKKNLSKLSRMLSMSRSHLYAKLNSLGISKDKLSDSPDTTDTTHA